MTDEKIVELYWERSEEAIKETDKQYGRYFHYIAKEILQDETSMILLIGFMEVPLFGDYSKSSDRSFNSFLYL